MPVISFVSPKGGVGKTTAATLLASELARKAPVIAIDADPNHPIAAWSRRGTPPAMLEVIDNADQNSIIDRIHEASERVPFVIVDCEGTASLTVSFAIGAADLVVIPTKGSQLDAEQAGRALALIRNTEKHSRRRIPHVVLFTMTNPSIRTRTLRAIKAEMDQNSIRYLATQLDEREAFRAMFSFGGTLDTLDPQNVPNLEKARVNARQYTAEIVGMLRDIEDGDAK